jgi:hypothetical protein
MRERMRGGDKNKESRERKAEIESVSFNVILLNLRVRLFGRNNSSNMV